jgi:hypothetical protein
MFDAEASVHYKMLEDVVDGCAWLIVEKRRHWCFPADVRTRPNPSSADYTLLVFLRVLAVLSAA